VIALLLLARLVLARRTAVAAVRVRLAGLAAAVALATIRPTLTRLTAETPGLLRRTTAAVVATLRGRTTEASLGTASVATTLVTSLVTETTTRTALTRLRTVVAATG
jgi:hypothetical protein